MKFNKANSFISIFYTILVIWWIWLYLSGTKDTSLNLAFAFAYGLMPIFGGLFGIWEAKEWGMFKSAMGKALFFLSAGLITWGVGEMIWSYYNFILQVEIPYPSWADASFIVSWPLWSIGVVFMSFATGARYGLKSIGGRLQLIAIPLLAAALSYYLLVVVARQGSFELNGGMLKIFFDLAYPIWDVVILTIALLIYGLSFKLLGGIYQWPVLITLFGFIVNYFADFGFSYTTTVGTFYNGNWVDLLFATAMFVLSFGVSSFYLKKG